MADGSCDSISGGADGAEIGEVPAAAAPPPGGPAAAEEDAVAACQAALRCEAALLKAAYCRVAELVRDLPRSEQETSWRDIGEEESADRSTMVRALALGVMADLLLPAVRGLLAAADYRPGSPVPEAVELDSELLALPLAGNREAGSGAAGLFAWPGPRVPENVEVTVERAGCLPLPAAVSHLLLLVPGDAVVLEPGPASLGLVPCREWVRGLRALPAGGRAQALAELRRGALTVVTPEGELPLPADLLPLAPGDVAVLQIQERGGGFRLYAFKDEPAEPGAAAARLEGAA